MSGFGGDKQFSEKYEFKAPTPDPSLELGHLQNEKYERLLKDYLHCMITF